jgi:hypothetical protein
MKRFSIKLFALFALVIALNNILFYSLHLPNFWGNQVAYSKASYLLENKKKFNTLFIGTSRTYYQTDVACFDSLTGYQTSSFNFGIEGINTTELIYNTDKIVALDSDIKYVFIELVDIGGHHDIEMNTLRAKYWFNAASWLSSLEFMREAKYPISVRLVSSFYLTVSYMEWLIKFDMFKDAAKFKKAPDLDPLGNGFRGYMSNENSRTDKESLVKRHQILLNDTTINQKLAQLSIDALTNFTPDKSSYYYRQFNSLIRRLNDKKITVFIVLPPRCYQEEYDITVPVFKGLDNCYKVNLADPRLNPEFYEQRYAFDKGHLLGIASCIYSSRIADVFNKKHLRK